MSAIRFFLGALVFFMGTGCVHNSHKGRLVNKHDAQDIIIRAKSIYDIGEISAAIACLRNFVDTKAYHVSHDVAYELMVQWLLQLNRYSEAKRIASYFLAHHQKSEHAQAIVDLFDQSLKIYAHDPIEKSAQEIHEENEPDEAISW